jgi:shikimate kinase
MGGYWKIVNKTPDAVIVVLHDTPENILRRITFYDIDSRAIQKSLTECDKIAYLGEIKKDLTYFGRSFHKAHVSVDITGCSVDEASQKVRETLTQWE